jgi:DNA-binding NarL/FixJ family response regulator
MDADKKYRVIVVDDDPMNEDGYRMRLQATGEFVIVAFIRTAEEAPSTIRRLSPDLVIMDLKFGEDLHAGSRAIRAIRQLGLSTRILATSNHPELISEAIEAGAHSAFVRGSSLQELLDKMRVALLPDIPDPLHHGKYRLSEPLTRREHDILLLIVKGFTNPEIASQLHLSLDTVKGHVSNVLAKLQVDTRSEVAGRALQLNLISPRDVQRRKLE